MSIVLEINGKKHIVDGSGMQLSREAAPDMVDEVE